MPCPVNDACALRCLNGTFPRLPSKHIRKSFASHGQTRGPLHTPRCALPGDRFSYADVAGSDLQLAWTGFCHCNDVFPLLVPAPVLLRSHHSAS